ncbi:hypothetical protein CL629_01550 [bacterium]|nr:hypothetical protein [bacterium]
MKPPIKHIWFDFSQTLAFIKKEPHDRLCYETYSQIIGKPVSEELIAEYKDLYKKYSSNSAVFRSLGQTSNFWSEKLNSLESGDLYKITDENVPEVLQKVRELVPMSLFSNMHLEKVLPALNINLDWFTHIISAGMVKEPKPVLDGFYKMIELSKVSAKEILYIGDDIEKDVRPAKKVGIQTGLVWKKSYEADYSFEKFEDILTIF